MDTAMNPTAFASPEAAASAAAAGARGLDEWALHTRAEIVGFATPADDDQAHTLLRLLEVGFLPGECVRLTACGLPGRDPLAVRVGQSTFALRRHEAALIRVATPGAAALAAAGTVGGPVNCSVSGPISCPVSGPDSNIPDGHVGTAVTAKGRA